MRKSIIIPKMVARVTEINGQQDIILRLLNSESASLFLRFVIPDFHQVIKVSGKWYVAFQQVLKEYLEQLDNKFIKTYFKVLSFKNSEFNATKFKYNDRQMFRWDRIIYAEVLPGFEGKQITLGFKQKIKQEYKFDIIAKKDIRTVWVLKQDTKHDYDTVSQTSCVQEIRVGDTIKIAINFYNRSICLDLSTLIFDPPKIEDRVQRQCPIEKYYFDWVYYQYYQHKDKPFDPAFYSMSPWLRMVDCRISGSDTRAVKFVFHADEKGKAYLKNQKGNQTVGIPIEITDGEIITEIMRYGLVADLQSTIMLKKNDILILYLTLGD